MAAIVIGIGMDLIFLLLEVTVKTMPTSILWAGMSLGVLLVLFGLISLLMGKRAKEKEGIGITAEVVSYKQQGGQTAKYITNIGIPPHRELTSINPAIVLRLSQFKDTPYGLAWVAGDNESQNFASQIDGMLQKAGWRKEGSGRATIMPTVRQGVDLRWRDDSVYGNAMQTLMASLQEMGFKAQRTDEKQLREPEIFVRSNVR